MNNIVEKFIAIIDTRGNATAEDLNDEEKMTVINYIIWKGEDNYPYQAQAIKLFYLDGFLLTNCNKKEA